VFLALVSAQFFEAPASLRRHLPDVYRQFERLYRQPPFRAFDDQA